MIRFWLVIRLYYQRHLRRRQHLLLLFLAIVLLSVDSINMSLLQPVRSSIERALFIITYPVSVSRDALDEGVRFSSSLFHKAETLEKLREENNLLRQWYEYAKALETENRQLKQYFSENRTQDAQTIQHFRLYGEHRRHTEPLLQIHLEPDQQLPRQAAVISSNGMVGRLDPRETAGTTAEKNAQQDNTALPEKQIVNVMLLSHPESRIPVQVGEAKIQAVLIGQGSKTALLDYYRNQNRHRIRLGDVVTSSSFLDYLPSDLYIGKVAKIHSEHIEVQLTFEPSQLRYIGVIGQKNPLVSPHNFIQSLLKKNP